MSGSSSGNLAVFEVKPDGTLGVGTLFTEGPGIGDGMKVDTLGNVPWQLLQGAFQMLRPTLPLMKAVSLIAANLERAVTHPHDLAARGAMLLASCYGGIGIDNCGTALAHNISHAVANLAAIPHGRATGLAMLATIGWVAEGNREGFSRVAQAMGSNDPVSGYERVVRASSRRNAPSGSPATPSAILLKIMTDLPPCFTPVTAAAKPRTT